MKIYLVNIFLHHFGHMPKYKLKEETKMAEQKVNRNLPKLVQFTLPEVEPFNDVISTLTTTSSKIETKISEVFSPVFLDFEGCKIIQTGIDQPLKCKLYFRPCINKTEDGIYAVKTRAGLVNNRNKTTSVYDMVNTVNMLSSVKEYDLEDVAKDILSQFVRSSSITMVERYDEELDKNTKIKFLKDWTPFVEEVSDRVIQSSRYQTIYFAVTLDLTLLVSKLYGVKDQEMIKEFKAKGNKLPKNKYQYSASIAKILNPTTCSYIIEVRRIDMEALAELAQSIGYGTFTGSIIMTRA